MSIYQWCQPIEEYSRLDKPCSAGGSQQANKNGLYVFNHYAHLHHAQIGKSQLTTTTTVVRSFRMPGSSLQMGILDLQKKVIIYLNIFTRHSYNR